VHGGRIQQLVGRAVELLERRSGDRGGGTGRRPQRQPAAPPDPVGLAHKRQRLRVHGGHLDGDPQVAGLATLLRATGTNDAAEIRARIRATADDRGTPGFDTAFGDGRINVYRALTQQDPFIAFENRHRGTVDLGANGTLRVVLYGQPAETYSLEQIRLDTVRQGNTQLATRPNGSLFATWNDVDGDGCTDLVLHFAISDLREVGELTRA
jgi:hypothetical protein